MADAPPSQLALRDVRVQAACFDTGTELARLEALGGGAVVSFTGLVRGGNALVALRLDHYPAMTARAIGAVADAAAARWPLLGLVLVHRHGVLGVGERIVFVGTAARHRAAALESCGFLIDWLKAKAPFWKQERFADGRTAWVEARAGDDAAAARWE